MNKKKRDEFLSHPASRTSHVLIFANADFAPTPLPPHDAIIAADGGARHVKALGLIPDEIVGDLDSLSEDEIAGYDRAGSGIHRYSPEKDETDLELALDFAAQHGAGKITCYGLFGGRWDMTFANLLLLADPRYAGIELQVVAGDATLYILRGGEARTISGRPGDTVSVIPLNGPAEGLTYTGLHWPLEHATLPFASPRGVSNTMAAEKATISLHTGVVVIVHHSPGPLPAPPTNA